MYSVLETGTIKNHWNNSLDAVEHKASTKSETLKITLPFNRSDNASHFLHLRLTISPWWSKFRLFCWRMPSVHFNVRCIFVTDAYGMHASRISREFPTNNIKEIVKMSPTYTFFNKNNLSFRKISSYLSVCCWSPFDSASRLSNSTVLL